MTSTVSELEEFITCHYELEVAVRKAQIELLMGATQRGTYGSSGDLKRRDTVESPSTFESHFSRI